LKISQKQIDEFDRDGVVMIKGLFKGWVDELRSGIERNINNPGPEHHQYISDDKKGAFFGDYCNWQRISEFVDVIENSDAGSVAAKLTGSNSIRVYHEHILVKESGTSMPTPWHQDSPYYFFEGAQTVSFWCPLDQVKDAALRCVAGSHKWPKPVMPMRWSSNEEFFPNDDDYIPVPDPDSDREKYPIKEWQMEPGDVVAFHYKTLHGSRGNTTKNRRRAFSLRLFGDDVHYVTRPGPCSPPFIGHSMKEGEPIPSDLFPIIYKK
jgi:ectoine hydroxylase-related dioxygenase (phytanoyl-CoA dioxygenase family)